MGDDSEWLKLPTDEKIQHKAWKARVAGYEEATKLFSTLGDERSPEFSKYLGLIKKMVIDSNAIAQEKALDAVLAYVENAHVAGKTTAEGVAGCITKCLNSSRTKTKEKGIEIILMYIEIEKQEIVQDELMKGLTNKQPKIVAGCIQVLRQALSEFGMKTILIKPMVKQLSRLLEDRDKNVREETKLLAVEIYRWIGQALKPQLANFKPVQVQELEAEFEKLPPGRPQQTRFLRSQQDLKAKMEEAAAAGDGEEGGEEDDAPADIDPFDMIEAVDILPKIPKDFYDKIEAKKWQERKEALSAIEKLVESPKIENGDFGDLVRAIKKVIAKDSNVMLVALAGKCLLNLALGLRKKFQPYAVSCIETILDKFKEKKVTVVTVIRDASDACFKAIMNLDPVCEQCVAALGNKNPQIKAETALFLSRSFSLLTMATLPKKLLKMFVTQLLKTINDTAPDVREASFTALGTAMKVVGEKPLLPFLADVDPIKMTKIKECCEKAVVVGKKAAAPAATAGVSAASAPVAAKKEAPKSVRGGGGAAKSAPEKKAESQSAPAARAGPKPGTSKPAGKKSAAPKGAPKGKKGKGGAAAAEENMEPALSDEAVEEKCSALLPGTVMTSLANSNWKERLAAMEKFLDVVKSMPRADINCQAFVRLITRKPGLKETNFQVLKLKVELIGHMAQNANFSKRSAEYCLVELVDKIGDVKNGAAVQETLSCITEACGLEYTSQQVITAAFEQKNPKNQAESLNWLAQAIKDFGFKVNIKPMLQYIKKAFGATNPAVRTAAITLVGVIYMYMGQTLRVFFEDEKPALLQQIDTEFEKVKGEKPPPATRGLTSADAADEEDEEEDEEAGQEGINVADLVPRNNISGSITPELLTEMADKNWKVRAEALQKLTLILNEAKFITPSIGGLPEALKARLGDSNKILVNTTVTICQTLATAMGPKVNQHVRVIGPGIIGVFGDTKPNIRAAAVAAANVWVEQTGLLPFVEAEIFSDALKETNPNLRTELLGWMAEKLPGCKKLPVELNMCTPHVFACLEDRNGAVRQKAQEVLVPYMIHVGYDSMARGASKLKPASKDIVVGHLEKAKAALPAKPVKAKAPKVAKVAPQPEVQPEVEDYDEPVKEPPKAAAAGKPKSKVLSKKAPPTSSKKKQEEVDTSPPMKMSNGKEQRQKDEKNLKVLKWNFTAPRVEFVDQLRAQMEPTFSATLMEQLFHTADFKMSIKAIETFMKVTETSPEVMIANLDLVLRWLSLRFFETNTTVLLKSLEFLQLLFNVLAENDYHLIEFEAGAFIPYLINKVGDPKDNVRRDIRTIFKLICKVYPASKMFSCLLVGLGPKNTKQKTECLEELGCLIESYGINVCQPSPAQALKLIATNINTRDNSVRSAALNTVCAAYSILGEAVYKYVGSLSDKDQGMLEERIKRYAKTRPATAPALQVEADKPAVKANNGRPATANPLQVNKNHNQNRMNNEPPTKPAVKKAFQLNLSEDEDMGPEDYELPKLIENNIDDVLYDPIQLPKTRLRPPSPSMKLLSGSNDAKSAIDLVISQIASNDVITSIQALSQIDEVLKDKEKADMMGSHVDQYLVMCTLQLRLTYSKQVSEESVDNDTVIRLYRCVLGSLLSMFRCRNLGKDASAGVLKDLFHVLITILLDQRLLNLDDGAQIVRSVNVLVVNIVQNSDKTAVMSALLRLLHESVAMETCPQQFLELIMKCLWKMMRMLPDIVNDLDIDRILLDIHNFLKAFPSASWRNRSSDVPMRTIRTILHTLAKLLGNKIMGHLKLIDPPHGSEVELYLQKVLKTGGDKNALANNAKNDAINGNDENVANSVTKETPRSTKRLSKTTHDMLAEIFKKIGSKENTREGLNDLYEFKKNYPDADLDPFLKKSSQFFQNYITRGLKTIEAEREGNLKQSSSSNKMDLIGQEAELGEFSITPSSSSGSISGGQNNAPQAGDIHDPAIYRARLKVLRARLGLDNKAPGEGEPEQVPAVAAFPHLESNSSSLSSSSSSGIAQMGVSNKKTEEVVEEEPAEKAAVNIVDLRKRLERIRQGVGNS